MQSKVKKIQRQIMAGDSFAKEEDLFIGADLFISTGKEKPQYGEVYVETEYAYELSGLVFALMEACSDWLDGVNKYAFFPQLGISANEYLAEQNDLKGLLLRVSSEALKIDKEFGG